MIRNERQFGPGAGGVSNALSLVEDFRKDWKLAMIADPCVSKLSELSAHLFKSFP